MTEQSIKDLLQSTMGDENYKMFKADHLAILDEGIEHILNGNIKINDKLPTTDDETLICLSKHFVTAMAAYQTLLQGLLKSDLQPDKIVVNYRGQEFVYRN